MVKKKSDVSRKEFLKYGVGAVVSLSGCLGFHKIINDLNMPQNFNQIQIDKIQKNPVEYPYDVVFIGDTHLTKESYPLLEKIKHLTPKPKFIKHLGDYTHYGTQFGYQKYFSQIKKLQIPVITVVGNHDLYFRGMQNYKNYFGKLDNFFDFGNERFIYLNNSSHEYSFYPDSDYEIASISYKKQYKLSNKQLKNLEELLDEPFPPNKIISMHIPPKRIKNGKGHTYEGFFFDCKEGFKNADKLIELIEKYNVKFSFSGHAHIYANYCKENNRYITTGGGGGVINTPETMNNPPQDKSGHHFVKITFESNGNYSGKLITLDGEDANYKFANQCND